MRLAFGLVLFLSIFNPGALLGWDFGGCRGRYTGVPSCIQPVHIHRHHQHRHNTFYIPSIYVYLMPQERIPVDVIRADATKHGGMTTRVMFYLGRCGNGDIWCQVGVTPDRFRSENDALRWVENSMGLLPGSIRNIDRRSVGSPWIISN